MSATICADLRLSNQTCFYWKIIDRHVTVVLYCRIWHIFKLHLCFIYLILKYIPLNKTLAKTLFQWWGVRRSFLFHSLSTNFQFNILSAHNIIGWVSLIFHHISLFLIIYLCLIIAVQAGSLLHIEQYDSIPQPHGCCYHIGGICNSPY